MPLHLTEQMLIATGRCGYYYGQIPGIRYTIRRRPRSVRISNNSTQTRLSRVTKHSFGSGVPSRDWADFRFVHLYFPSEVSVLDLYLNTEPGLLRAVFSYPYPDVGEVLKDYVSVCFPVFDPEHPCATG